MYRNCRGFGRLQAEEQQGEVQRSDHDGDQKQGEQFVRYRPEERDQEKGDTGKADGGKEQGRHLHVRHNPPRQHDIEAPDEADTEQEKKIAEIHVCPVSGFSRFGQTL